METRIENITPEKAKEYLLTSLGNRNISKMSVRTYANEMKRQRWLLNGEAIKFDHNGHLLDGHHRLNACILANVAFDTLVIRDISPETFASFDCGLHRTAGQLLGMQKVKDANVVASIITFAQALKKNVRIGEKFTLRKGINCTNLDKMEWYNEDRENYNRFASIASSLYTQAPLMDKAMIGGCMYYLVRCLSYDADYVIDFFRKLMSYSQSGNKAIDMLRERLLREKCEIRKTPRPILLALLIKTWNLHITGKSVKCLKYTAETEDYPRFK